MKKIYLLSLLSILSLNLFSQVHWTKYENNPVMVPGASGDWDEEFISPGSVIYHDSTYHMWYWGGNMEIGNYLIGHAISPDGITWTKDTNNPVLDPGPEGSWDSTGVSDPTVIFNDSIFHMWYTGHGIDDRIGHATSPDGITWTKDTNNPVLEWGPDGDWDDQWVSQPEVIFNGNEYHMWYTGYNGIGDQNRIGHATSPDGITWMKDPLNPVISYEAGSWDYPQVRFPKVVLDTSKYHMWYSGGRFALWQKGYATSEDGSIWIKHPNNPILEGTAGSWDANNIAFSAVNDSVGVKYKMWYMGNSADTNGIGYAESDTRVPYLSVIESKPVFDSTDTIVAEIVLDGNIYIVLEGTSPVVDSILKYMVTSAEVLANTEAEIPLTDLSIGKYTILGVSTMGFVSTNPYPLEVVADASPPSLTLDSNIVKQGDTIYATSNKDGTIYLVNEETPADLKKIRMLFTLQDSLTAQANIPVEFPSAGLSVKDYWLYAVDIYGFISKPDTVTIVPGTGVEENINTGISIYPNPANDLIIIETNKVGQYFIELNSINGQLIYSTKMEGPTHQIDLSSFQKGLYFITIRSRDYVMTKKIIKL